MYSGFQIAMKYLKYYLSASNGRGHGIHSPFVFEFVSKILNDHTGFETYSRIEQVRKKMLDNNQLLAITDYGAGSATNVSKTRSVRDIMKNVVKRKKYCSLLFRIAKFYECNRIIELG